MMGRKFNLVYDGEIKHMDTFCEVCGEKTIPSAMICQDCFEVLKELILERKDSKNDTTGGV
jgi:uncharacterized OB-fold protein